MKKFLPLTAFALLLAACSGGNGGTTDTTPQAINVTGTWSGSLQTPTGGGLGAAEITLTQSAAPATNFTGNYATPNYGGKHPLIGDVAQGTLKTDTASIGSDFNQALTLNCTGQFTQNVYRGDCLMGNAKIVLVLGRK